MNIIQKNTVDYEKYNWINLNLHRRIENVRSFIESLKRKDSFVHKNRFNYYKKIIDKI